ncbi:O-antigen ligase family protein [uncultured Hymenobacter sp.]|uniref:O-antigen ligase family protein n=1 Tax=uncultured Hymenobacter sp. TaxID=170016 RepID=UPI0035CAC953
MKLTPSFSETLLNSRWLLPAALAGALGLGWLAGQAGPAVPGLLIAMPLLVLFTIVVFYYPRAGFIAYISYCFLINHLSRHVLKVPVGLAMEAILIITWLAVLFYRSEPPDWRRVQNDLCKLTLVWFVINLLEVVNPAGASLQGWFYDLRSNALLWLMTVPLGFLVLRQRRDLNMFIYLVIGFSALGALYGIKQKYLGVDDMEQYWLNQGAARTHVLWGKLRVFSGYSEAAQFGNSQAHVALICLILALGPYSWQKRLLLASACLLLLYGMLISGTRGAFFVLVVGILVYLLLSKRLKVLILGCLLAGGAFMTLKYTTIGNSNADVFRMRTAVDPNDPSLRVRLANQALLREYLSSRPFGGGAGTMGSLGLKYNAGTFLSKVPPDSYFVKVWGQYGIVGFLIWFGIILFTLGKCAGIVWRIRDPGLRQKLLALTAGFSGILLGSYANEIMNQMPSSMIVYLTWVFILSGPDLDTPRSVAAENV